MQGLETFAYSILCHLNAYCDALTLQQAVNEFPSKDTRGDSNCFAGYFIYLNWLPSYFNKVLGVNLRSSALLSFLPWLVMAIGCSAAGVIADKQVASGALLDNLQAYPIWFFAESVP